MNRKLLKEKIYEKRKTKAAVTVICEVCNVSYPTAHNWLSGKTKMPVDYLKTIQDKLEFTDTELLDIFVR